MSDDVSTFGPLFWYDMDIIWIVNESKSLLRVLRDVQ